MDHRYSQALRGIRVDGTMGDFLKEATAVLSEKELRDLVNAASYELDKYKKFCLNRPNLYDSTHPQKDLVGMPIASFTDVQLNMAILRKYQISKTMLKALKKERVRRKKGRGDHGIFS